MAEGSTPSTVSKQSRDLQPTPSLSCYLAKTTSTATGYGELPLVPAKLNMKLVVPRRSRRSLCMARLSLLRHVNSLLTKISLRRAEEEEEVPPKTYSVSGPGSHLGYPITSLMFASCFAHVCIVLEKSAPGGPSLPIPLTPPAASLITII